MRLVAYSASLVVGMGVAAALPAHAEIAGQNDPNVLTHRQLQPQRLAFHRKYLVEAYKASGRRDDKWDAAAIRLLEGVARQWTNFKHVPMLHVLLDAPSEEAIWADARACMEAGCDDPLVNYLSTYSMWRQGQAKRDALKNAAARLGESSYAPHLRVLAAVEAIPYRDVEIKINPADLPEGMPDQIRQMLGMDGQDEAPLRTIEFNAMRDGFAEGAYSGVERRFFYHLIRERLGMSNHWPAERRDELLEAIRSAKPDPWLLAILEGNFHLLTAWDHRGSGFAHTVSDEGWIQFRNWAGRARASLLRAYELEPGYPEAATYMITVVRAEGEDTPRGESERFWFERATRAQFDDILAHAWYRDGILPRWGGSYEQMMDLAREYVATGRFDTSVPERAMRVMEVMIQDAESHQLWEIPIAVEVAQQVLGGYVGALEPGPVRSWYLGRQTGLKWLTKDMAGVMASDMLLDDPWFVRGALDMGMIPTQALLVAQATTGPHGAKLQAIERDLARKADIDQAVESFQAVQSSLPETDPAARHARSRVAELEWVLGYLGEEAFGIQPDAQLTGWFRTGGEWFVDSAGGLTARTANHPAGLVSGMALPQAFELSFDLTIESDPQAPVGPTIEVVVGSMHDDDPVYVQLGRRGQRLVGRYFGTEGLAGVGSVDASETYHIDIDWNGLLLWVSANGEPFFEREIPFSTGRIARQPGNLQIKLIPAGDAPAVARITNLTLKQRPPAASERHRR